MIISGVAEIVFEPVQGAGLEAHLDGSFACLLNGSEQRVRWGVESPGGRETVVVSLVERRDDGTAAVSVMEREIYVSDGECVRVEW